MKTMKTMSMMTEHQLRFIYIVLSNLIYFFWRPWIIFIVYDTSLKVNTKGWRTRFFSCIFQSMLFSLVTYEYNCLTFYIFSLISDLYCSSSSDCSLLRIISYWLLINVVTNNSSRANHQMNMVTKTIIKSQSRTRTSPSFILNTVSTHYETDFYLIYF